MEHNARDTTRRSPRLSTRNTFALDVNLRSEPPQRADLGRKYASEAFESAAGGWDREEELPAPLRCGRRRSPHERVRKHAQTHTLLRASLIAAVGWIGNDIVGA